MSYSPRFPSPLRYPGGKGAFAPFLTEVLIANDLLGCDYYEPFAGGAGAALKLLQSGHVSSVHLNDADVRIYYLWKAIFTENEKFVARIAQTDVSINEWGRQLNVCQNPRHHSAFEVAFSTFFLNRCNRSGVILGSRPIGGMSQQGTYAIDARFDKQTLAARVKALAAFSGSVRIYNQDALSFMKERLPAGKARNTIFVYLDPPYYSKARRLYLNYYSDKEHASLSRYMNRQRKLHWLMSYDKEPAIRKLYGNMVRGSITVEYSLYSRRKSREILIAPDHVVLPRNPSLRKLKATQVESHQY